VWPSCAGAFRRALLIGALALALATPNAGFAGEPAAASVLSWETGEGKSYLIPALEIPAFILGLHLFDRFLGDTNDYDSDLHSIRKNLTSATVIDHDPFSTNQIGHPYQGSIYYGFARSAGLNYWQSLAYTAAGSYLWETFAEKTPPSLNDHIASGIAGSFVGEALFRMASLLLEGGGEKPGFWRELGAAAISPPTGFNRLVFGDRFDAVFPSRNPEVFIRLRLGATLTTDVHTGGLTHDFKEQEGSLDYSIIYGLPGKPGYKYTRPFDYFQFEITAVPNADPISNLIENAAVRGLLLGTNYELGDAYRGIWGLFGIFDYLSPQIFRVSTTALSLGTVNQWWLTRRIALQGTVLGGVGFGAAGTVGDQAERDYHYGVVPQVLVGLRAIFGERLMVDATGRQYYVAGKGTGGGISTSDFGGEIISRLYLGFTVRVYGPHGIGVQYLISTRDTSVPGQGDRHQRVESVNLTYNFLGHTRFGAVEWRPEEIASR
jgi:Domain of unknown function (DUF3943)